MAKVTKATTKGTPDVRERALEMLAAGATTVEVAKALAINRTTLWKWRQSLDFAGKLATARQEQTEVAHRDLAAMVSRVVEVLAAILEDVLTPPAVRLRACELILDRAGISGPVPPQTMPDDVEAVARFLVENHPDAIERAKGPRS